MSRHFNTHERQALAIAERLVDERPGCQLAFVVMSPPEGDVTHCDLVPLCDRHGLVVAGLYLLSTARRQLDPLDANYATEAKRLDAALAPLEGTAEFVVGGYAQ